MSDAWTCTDCGAAVPRDEIHEHLQHEHGVNYSAPLAACPACTESQPCARVDSLTGRD